MYYSRLLRTSRFCRASLWRDSAREGQESWGETEAVREGVYDQGLVVRGPRVGEPASFGAVRGDPVRWRDAACGAEGVHDGWGAGSDETEEIRAPASASQRWRRPARGDPGWVREDGGRVPHLGAGLRWQVPRENWWGVAQLAPYFLRRSYKRPRLHELTAALLSRKRRKYHKIN